MGIILQFDVSTRYPLKDQNSELKTRVKRLVLLAPK